VNDKVPISGVSARGAGLRPATAAQRVRWTPGAGLMRRLSALLLLGVVALGHAGDLSRLESQKIDYLITSVATLGDAKFIRNGKAYDAKTAAEHLRLKLRNAGRRVKTAEDFIRYCGSVSSVSGVPYQIRFSDGRVVTSEQFLRQQLSEFQSH
jgi:hypothetical protein